MVMRGDRAIPTAQSIVRQPQLSLTNGFRLLEKYVKVTQEARKKHLSDLGVCMKKSTLACRTAQSKDTTRHRQITNRKIMPNIVKV